MNGWRGYLSSVMLIYCDKINSIDALRVHLHIFGVQRWLILTIPINANDSAPMGCICHYDIILIESDKTINIIKNENLPRGNLIWRNLKNENTNPWYSY